MQTGPRAVRRLAAFPSAPAAAPVWSRKAREAGAAEQASLVAEAQKRAQEIIAETRRNLQAEADASLKELRGQVATLSGQLAERVLRG